MTIDEKQAALLIAHFKDVQAAVMDSTIKMIDTTIVRIVLPVFTSFVGFVFGSQARDKSS
jgi:hypothetical protein